jgi:anthranilate synthase component II
VIDNFDSFTFNLVHYLEQLCESVVVKRNNDIQLYEIGGFDKIVLSPGPGIPSEVPILKRIIQQFGKTKPFLGVCLGHQAIAETFGGKLKNLEEPSHGKPLRTFITDRNDYLFQGLPDTFETGRYHSWVVNEKILPEELVVTSVDEAGHIMSLRHKNLNIRGVQFHPESVMTFYGMKIIQNWVEQQV